MFPVEEERGGLGDSSPENRRPPRRFVRQYLCVWVGWCGRRNLNRRLSSFLVLCVGLMVRATGFEPSWEMMILCVGNLVRAPEFTPS